MSSPSKENPSHFHGDGDVHGQFIHENMIQYSIFIFGLENQTFLALKNI